MRPFAVRRRAGVVVLRQLSVAGSIDGELADRGVDTLRSACALAAGMTRSSAPRAAASSTSRARGSDDCSVLAFRAQTSSMMRSALFGCGLGNRR